MIFFPSYRLVKIIDLKRDVRHSLHEFWYCAVLVKSHPLNAVRRRKMI